jgi:hypothetical protein
MNMSRLSYGVQMIQNVYSFVSDSLVGLIEA